VTRRADLLGELASLREHATTPRVDSTRNRIAATATLLGDVLPHIDDLHALAYDRAAARRDAVVAGGSRDYALDTHGDPNARQAYKHLALATVDACEILAEAAHDALVLFRTGDHDHNAAGRVTEEELALALVAKARRIARGEAESIPVGAQPHADLTARVLQRVIAERDALQRKVDRYERDHPKPKREKRGWRKTPKDV
jgi:hypothetical protein